MNATTERRIKIWQGQLAICTPEAKESIEIYIALLQAGLSHGSTITRQYLKFDITPRFTDWFATWENFYAFAERLETGEFDGLLLSGRNVGAKTLADFKQAVAKVVASRSPA